MRRPLSALRGGLFSGCRPLESVTQCAVLVGSSAGVTAKTIPQCVPSVGEGAGAVRFGGFVQWTCAAEAIPRCVPLVALLGGREHWDRPAAALFSGLPAKPENVDSSRHRHTSPPRTTKSSRRLVPPAVVPSRPSSFKSKKKKIDSSRLRYAPSTFGGFLRRARALQASPVGVPQWPSSAAPPNQPENADPSRHRHTSPPPTTTKSKNNQPHSKLLPPMAESKMRSIPASAGAWCRCRCRAPLGISPRPSQIKINCH